MSLFIQDVMFLPVRKFSTRGFCLTQVLWELAGNIVCRKVERFLKHAYLVIVLRYLNDKYRRLNN